MIGTARFSARSPYFLAVCSGFLLGISYPPLPLGYCAAIAFLPWLWAVDVETETRRFLRITFLMLLVWSVITLYWSGALFGSPLRHRRDFFFLLMGCLIILINPLPYLILLGLWNRVRNAVGSPAGWLLLPLFWIAAERLSAMTEILTPWTVVGSVMSAYPLPAQIASFGGVGLVSLWLLLLNIIAFLFLRSPGREHRVRRTAAAAAWLIILAVPHAAGWYILADAAGGSSQSKLDITVVQPDVNAYEKWNGRGADEVAHLIAMTRAAKPPRSGIVIWPESAIPLYIFDPENDSLFRAVRSITDSMGIRLVTGYDEKRYYSPGQPVMPSRKVAGDGRAYDVVNGVMLIAPGPDPVRKYGKMLLVPFAEAVPYAHYLPSLNLDFLRWNLGFDDCAPGTDTTVFSLPAAGRSNVNFSVLICYESAFPEFTSAFIRKGAQFLVVVTNDSWWGNTPGPYQHQQMSVLRAIENRCWVIQCANGGISSFVDPWGRTAAQSKMFSAVALSGTIDVPWHREPTFFTRHGDWPGDWAIGVVIVLVLGFLPLRSMVKGIAAP